MKSTIKIEQKRQLRQLLREQERCLTAAVRCASDQRLTERFLNLVETAAADTILLYCSMGAEPDTTVLLRKLVAKGKQIALPRCLPNGELETRVYQPQWPLISHPYGMLEPGLAHPLIMAGDIDLALVPALAYDQHGMRLGRGGGYYDRYLPGFSSVTVGMCRDVLLQKHLPAECHDQSVDLVLTETRTFYRKGNNGRPEGEQAFSV